MTRRVSPALLALTTAALGLPGLARGQEAGGARLDYRYSTYREDALPAGASASGQSVPRYEIDSHQLRTLVPAGERVELGVDFSYETMSGASPWYTQPDASGRPVQVMSGATISEQRADTLLRARRRGERGSAGLSLGYSSEEDYAALNAGLDGELVSRNGLETLSAGVGFSDDELSPADGGSPAFPTRITEAQRDTLTAFAGYGRALGADTAAQTSLSFTQHGGYLSDPYKLAFVGGVTVPDARPDERRQWAWLTRLRHFFAGVRAALHADYRFYRDDWKITSHTVDLAWHQNLGDSWRLVPAVRWYSQSQAFFYAPFYGAPRADGHASSDYRLSPYGALSGSLAAVYDADGWGLSLRYERYDSGAHWAAGDVGVENPGLVDFDVISAGVRKTF